MNERVKIEKLRRISIPLILVTFLVLPGCSSAGADKSRASEAADSGCDGLQPGADTMSDEKGKIEKTDDEWRCDLTEEQYRVTRHRGTERAFSGKYYAYHQDGVYLCVCCGNELFSSQTKYDSGSGWPSFNAPLAADKVDENSDRGFGLLRTEVTCSRCDAHLGHVFDDGPQPTGLRYCINSAALDFMETEGPADDGRTGKEHLKTPAPEDL